MPKKRRCSKSLIDLRRAIGWHGRTRRQTNSRGETTGRELANAFDAFWQVRLDAARSEVPTAVETLFRHLEKKTVVRRQAEPPEFFLAPVRYRNDTIGHGAGLSDEKNQAHGEAILRAASQLAGEMPLRSAWEMKYLAGTTLGPTSANAKSSVSRGRNGSASRRSPIRAAIRRRCRNMSCFSRGRRASISICTR